ncbi:glycerophosphodiester phosphodiesterase [Paenibacillus azoreducens]|uniref:Glycerophosphoryl diester phosphodiesterase n=1 Tax=Paenibacillus azoreducens TaxID=116718 RepID=A0A919YEI8_9BACL|nr:glycerophosphodiester phosphodiesterase [Paenibacillus azoreducens]GIO49727.1 glycerophosphoryl diester phosphodiesterase [Paenibacillus azoreducens]
MGNVINFAHRGSSKICPENTMAAFKKGLEQGATGIETDVQLSKDGRMVLIHDETLDRTTSGTGWVKDHTLEELKHLDAGSKFDPVFQGEQIPLLDELLELTKESGTIINIELKNGTVMYEGLEEKVIELVRAYHMSERVIISSFNHYSLSYCKKLAPEIRTGILYMEGLYEPWEYAKTLQADALHAYHRAVLPEFVAKAKSSGKAYHPFTVNDCEEMERLLQAGVDGIITDYPDRLAALLAAKV